VNTTVGAERLYLQLLKGCLTRMVVGEAEPFDADKRRLGRDRPQAAETMIGSVRLDNLQHCIESVLHDNIPGDLIETGVWRGGATILMRGVLAAHGITDRIVWVADSFAGLPPPNTDAYPADAGDPHWTYRELVVPLKTVQENFARYGLLDEQVRFLVGWFRDTLQTAPIERLAVARLDGDMYESTMDALVALYPKLAIGGYLIVDDYGAVPGCRRAIDEYRERHAIIEPMTAIDWTGVFWRREG
jgi:O-methyltransferase